LGQIRLYFREEAKESWDTQGALYPARKGGGFILGGPNIMVTKKGEIILMDMGVIKIVGNPSMTDVAKKEFLGTLRYAPPEFLMRKEEDSLNGWRAINIYQIGAVLHDLIMKKELYAGIEPYPAMIIVIKEDMPQVISTEYHPDLIQLTREMLHKDWKERLKLTPIDRVKAVLEKCLLPQDEPTNYYNKLKTNAHPIQNEIKKLEDIARSKEEKIKIMHKIHNSIWSVNEEAFNEKRLTA
jgi:serine/threonine protein kinase